MLYGLGSQGTLPFQVCNVLSGLRSDSLEPAGRPPRSVREEGRYKATLKREFKLPWRKASLLISMMKWTRTSRLSIKISLSL